ncbi:hypothetical protein D8Y22_08580 [Salinadaptatus halalkaliphilus]|uniref:Nucleotidyltransferase domain-containing protein n=1 Tax=Salinadaptatus halalkaliphilus TaxID=2419781 RepID=A0A4S3TM42_9EURY|nr:hypothetical protein [Salinadaptatus halalkaliphilus]THE65252.1 hypothetical protein D8Y22_08580 [Salinadaptatus halalkaliphilus]
MSDGSQRTTAPDAFATQAQASHGESIRHLVVAGDAVGDDHFRTEMDVLLVLETDDPDCERELEHLARQVGLDHGVVVTVNVLPADRFDAVDDHPFVEQAFADGTVYV